MRPGNVTSGPAVLHRRCDGLTLVEVLIALLVLSIGLLGLAGLHTLSLQYNTSAYYRSQATALAYDLADRMRANRAGALADQYNGDFQDPPPVCDPAVSGGGTAALDVAAWRNALACRLPQGTGAIVRVDPNGVEFTFIVRWNDTRGTDDPTDFQFTTAL
jgi:type IV pilus assembly protein PilV